MSPTPIDLRARHPSVPGTAPLLADTSPWQPLGHRYAEVDSTMAAARTLAEAGAPEGSWVLAARQTAGRGRRGRTWQSEPCGGVYMTLLLRPDTALSLAGLPLVFGLAAVRALDSVLAPNTARIGLKWPNDIVVGDQKLGGILVEADGIGTAHPIVRVGLGLNVAPGAALALAPDVAARYVGLMQLLPAGPEQTAEMWVETLAQRLVAACYGAYTGFCQMGLGPTIDAWPQRDALVGRRVTAEQHGQTLVGIAAGLGPDGRLRLKTPHGCVWVHSGEVLVHPDPRLSPPDLTQPEAAVYVGLTPEAP